MINQELEETSSRVRRWDAGEELSSAWFICASREAKRNYKKCDSNSRRMSLRLDMRLQVRDDLISGKLDALGIREGAPLEEGPIPIPAHLFPRGGDDTAEIDWDMSVLRSSGYSFSRIRVAKPPRSMPPRETEAGPPKQVTGGEPEKTFVAAAPPADVSNGEGRRENKPSVSRMGRPSKDAQIREIFN